MQLTQEDILIGIQRHQAGDWGDVDQHDRQANELALTERTRLWSAYRSAEGVKFWMITEPDRSVTTVLMPEEGVRVARTPDVEKSTANGQQDSEVLTESRVSELTVDTSIESPFRISHYPYSRFWAVYDGNDLVAVTVYKRGAEEVRRRLQTVAAIER